MPTYILKLTDPTDQRAYYMAWSTVVDAPLTWGMSLDEFKAWYRDEYGRAGMDELELRLRRVEETGCSGRPPFHDLNDMVSGNRAGYKERCLSMDDILEWYCRRPHPGDACHYPTTSDWRKQR